MSRPYPGTKIHSVIAYNPETATGECAVCGPVKVQIKKPYGNRKTPTVRCMNAVKASYRRTNRGKHGLTMDEAKEYVKGKHCRLCGKDFDLVVDHDAETNTIRGVLCRPHNVALGLLGDQVQYLEAAIQYLKGEEPSIYIPMHDSLR